MGVFAVCTLIVYGVVINLWKLLHVLLCFYKPNRYFLGAESPPPAGRAPLVSILLAARDEEGNVGHCVESLLRSNYPNFELIVIDDRSRDGTAREVELAIGDDQRARLLRVEELPPGWTGKMHAVRRGLDAARGEFVLVTDADTRHSPQALGAAVGAIERRKTHLLSLVPRFENRTLFSRVVQPLVGAVLFFWKPLMWVNSRKHKRVAIAWGGFLLLRRKTLDAIGGLESVRDCFAADIALATRMKQARHRIRVFHAPALISTHLYTTPREMIDGWTRILRLTATGARLPPLVTLAALSVCGVSAYVAIAAGVAELLRGGADKFWLALGALGVVHLVVQSLFLVRLYRIGGSGPRYALAHLPAMLVTVYLLLLTIARGRRSQMTWRGTSYEVTNDGRARPDRAHRTVRTPHPAPAAAKPWPRQLTESDQAGVARC